MRQPIEFLKSFGISFAAAFNDIKTGIHVTGRITVAKELGHDSNRLRPDDLGLYNDGGGHDFLVQIIPDDIGQPESDDLNSSDHIKIDDNLHRRQGIVRIGEDQALQIRIVSKELVG